MKINGQFESIEEAFAFCRECNRPVVVMVNEVRYRLFPSGTAYVLNEVYGVYGHVSRIVEEPLKSEREATS